MIFMTFSVAIISPNKIGHVGAHLVTAFRDRQIPIIHLSAHKTGLIYNQIVKKNILWPESESDTFDVGIIRGIGSQIPSHIFYRLDWLWLLEHEGFPIVNSRDCLELATNKILTTHILNKQGILNPDTILCENAELALKAFDEFKQDIIIKPLYGSRGRGVFRIQRRDQAEAIFRELEQIDHIFYIQPFLEHNNEDYRLLVVGGQVVAAMKRKAKSWKTNLARGGIPEYFIPNENMKEMAIKAADAVKGEIIGVDLMETKHGLMVIEVNAVPGYMGLQSICPFNISEKIVDYVIDRYKH
jgi:RimK family alpha-L-glutamate ligase